MFFGTSTPKNLPSKIKLLITRTSEAEGLPPLQGLEKHNKDQRKNFEASQSLEKLGTPTFSFPFGGAVLLRVAGREQGAIDVAFFGREGIRGESDIFFPAFFPLSLLLCEGPHDFWKPKRFFHKSQIRWIKFVNTKNKMKNLPGSPSSRENKEPPKKH